jgi:DNA-directed RNA polymerase subunit beta'
VLVDAAIKGKVDGLRGLKENVILGKLIPSRVLYLSPDDEKKLRIGNVEEKEETASLELASQ